MTPSLKIIAEKINLTDKAIDQYTDITTQRPLSRTKSDRTFTVGATCEFYGQKKRSKGQR
ncbi:hypothetical protein [Asticcacaulis sp. AND118]|uniref:hypothetical protein n=1 Tax=Asticcacaulis sp. AND118 TaxID=2840468 RepID=UPI001CFFB390|nr:hypothetical protein [Asticcacaulis sp. AND118]UDF03057.1 hypothetical protein LH365_11535 [Asticcacaulis sp. AND118]